MRLALGRPGPEREGDAPPGVEVRGRARQVEDDAAHRDDDVGPQFEQPVAQPGHLGAGTRRTRRAQPELLHQDVGRSRPEVVTGRGVAALELPRVIVDAGAGTFRTCHPNRPARRSSSRLGARAWTPPSRPPFPREGPAQAASAEPGSGSSVRMERNALE